jgi:glyoxylase-like metal-dependent hydrolase (beta-lactamase superfamily II)
MLKFQRFVFNPFYENTYLIWDNKSKDAAIIDCGCYDLHEQRVIDDFIEENHLLIKYLINTHLHIDHVFGNKYIKEKYNPVFMAPAEDMPLLDFMLDMAMEYHVVLDVSPLPDQKININENLILGESVGEFLFTPGHTPGEVCLYFEKEKICFTGDVLFKESIGRTDLWRGDSSTLIESIRTQLLTLPDDVTIYPGHESFSTIGFEKKN